MAFDIGCCAVVILLRAPEHRAKTTKSEPTFHLLNVAQAGPCRLVTTVYQARGSAGASSSRCFFDNTVVGSGMPKELPKLVWSLPRSQWWSGISNTRSLLVSRTSRRCITIQQTPASSTPTLDSTQPAFDNLDAPSGSQVSETPDARFEVLGATSSLLSVALSASQNLYTRRGTLVGVNGSPDNATSSLSPLSPLLRAITGIPFLYQKVSSTTPISLLVAAKTPHTSFSVLHLDGRVDWAVAQRNGLLAWSGHTLSVKPNINVHMTLAHWGNSTITGRGLVALAAAGNTFQVSLGANESYVIHPSNVLAYTLSQHPPQPYRFKSGALRFQLPSLGEWLPDNNYLREVRKTQIYLFMSKILHTLRTWTRRTIWGDRLFLQFQGPTTILVQSRGSRIRDVLTPRDATEIADAPAGITRLPPTLQTQSGSSSPTRQVDAVGPSSQQPTRTKMSYASVGNTGVKFSKE